MIEESIHQNRLEGRVNMKELIGYKVVTTGLKSAIVGNTACSFMREENELMVKYAINEWVKPNKEEMPLMIFKSVHEAQTFIYNNLSVNSHLYIYKCKYIKSKKRWGWCLGFTEDVLVKRKQKKKISHLLGKLPDGTILADAVMLLEEVK